MVEDALDGGGEEAFDLLAVEDGGEVAGGFGAVELFDVLAFVEALNGEVFAEGAESGDAAGDGFGVLAGAGLVLEVFAVVEAGGGFDGLAALGEVGVEVGEVAAVGEEGVFGEAAFGGEVGEEGADLWGDGAGAVVFLLFGVGAGGAAGFSAGAFEDVGVFRQRAARGVFGRR